MLVLVLDLNSCLSGSCFAFSLLLCLYAASVFACRDDSELTANIGKQSLHRRTLARWTGHGLGRLQDEHFELVPTPCALILIQRHV
jgi:hypothetical protein